MRIAGLLTVATLVASPYVAEANAKDDSVSLMEKCTGLDFGSWSEQGLRSYLLERGVVSPGSTFEKLVQLAKKDCSSLVDEVNAAIDSGKDAASSQFDSVMSIASSVQSELPSKTSVVKASAQQFATNAASEATNSAKSAVTMASKVGHAASTSVANQWDDVASFMDDTKDYVYSHWSEEELRSWLRSHGIDLPSGSTKQTMLEKIREPFAKENFEAPYKRLSTDYLRRWLVQHGYLATNLEKTRDEYLELAKQYYFYFQDNVYDTWTQADLRSWLVDHKIIPTDWSATRDEYLKLVKDKYTTVLDSIWAGWKESDMRQYLSRQGVLDSHKQYSFDDLKRLMQEHAQAAASSAVKYVSWSDAKLRGFLKDHGVSLESLPKDRHELLRLMRAYYSPSWSAEWHDTILNFLTRVKYGVRDMFGRSAEQVYHLNADKIGSYVSTAKASASSLLYNRDEL